MDNDDGVVLDHTLEQGNPADAPRLAPAIKRVIRRTGRKPRTVTADRGRLLPDASSLRLSGNVVIRGTEARGSAVIRTDELTYDTKTSLVQTAEPVAVQFGEHTLSSRGLRAALNDGTLRLESNVHGQFKP